jgi:hypothetical protein
MTQHQNINPNNSVQIIDPRPKPKNALVHGVYAEDVVLPSEDKTEFDELLRQYREELNPIGTFEEGIVGQITQLQWVKRRLLRDYRMRCTIDPRVRSVLEALKSGELALDKLREETTFTVSPKEFDALVVAYERKLDEIEAGKAKQASTPAPAQSTEQQQKIRDVEVAAEHMTASEDLDRFLKTLGSLDTRIEKAIARLAGVKEYKKLYGPKQVTG